MDNSTRQAKRAPVTLKIKFKSETLAQFIDRYAVDVSPGGIFIRTKEPLAVGTPMKFEFQLRDASPLITGEGTVVWTRENDPARPNAAPGMGVRFNRLGDGSQTVLDKILAEKNKHGAAAAAEPQQRMFTDAPTRVAPSPLVGQLLGESRGKLGEMAPPRAGFGEERTDTTPLPRPMPFHSDAEEFPDETFEEATKVRSVEDLIAATAHGGAASLKSLTRTTLQTSMPPAPPSAPARTSPPIPPPPPTGALHPAPIPIPPPPRPTPAMPMPAQAAPAEAEAPDADPPTTPIEPRAAASAAQADAAPAATAAQADAAQADAAQADAAQADAAQADAAQADGADDVVSADDAGVELAAPMAEDAALPTVPAVDVAAAQPDAESELAPPPSPRPTPPMPIKAAEPPADDAAATPGQDADAGATATPGIASTEPAADASADASAELGATTEPEAAPIVAEETTAPREPTPMPRPAATATPAAFESEETQRVKPIATTATAAATPAAQGARKRPTGVPVPPPELTDPNRKHGVTAAAQLEPPPGVGTGMVVMAVVFVAALVGLVWFFFLRGDTTPEPPAVLDDETEVTTAPTGAGTGSAPTATDQPLVVDDTGSAQPTGKTVPTQIRATVVDAMVSIPGTNLSGPAPFVANLVKDEPYTARVSAPGYRTKSIALTGGQKPALVKLEPMPRIIHVSSNPPGATVLIDGESTGRKTPTNVALSPRQAAKASIKVGVSKANYTSFAREVVASDFVVDGDEMVMAIDAELVAKARGESGGGERAGGGGAGAAGGGGAGADAPAPAPAPAPTPPSAAPAAPSTDTLN